MSILLKPHCTLIEIGNALYEIRIRAKVQVGRSLILESLPVAGSNNPVFRFKLQNGGSGSDHWEGPASQIYSMAKPTSAPPDYGPSFTVEIYDTLGNIAGLKPKGRTIIRTVDADDNGA